MRMWIAVALVLAGAGPAAAQSVAKRIDGVMKDWAGTDSPGCAVAVIQNGKTVHAKGYGMADLERGVPITPDTVFDIGSTSKQFTATSILLLAADGKLRLDDDIRAHLPELPALGKQPTTIRHLLHHTGGLRDYMAILMFAGKTTEDVATSKETLAALARQRGRDFEPGTKYEYSNTGYFVLAQLVERVSKGAMAKFAEDRILKPLGMTRTLVYDDHKRLVPRRAIGYAPRSGGGWQLEMSQWEQTGDGAVMTTVLDLAKWDANFYDPKVGGRALLDGLHQRGKLTDGKELDYAAGLLHGTYRGQATVSHGGAWAGYRAQLERFPALKSSVIVLCNSASAAPGKLARAIADVVLHKQLGPAEAAPPPPARAASTVKLTPLELDAWVGRYRDGATGAVVSITRTGDVLAVAVGAQSITLEPTSKRAFNLASTPMVIELEGVAPRRKAVFRYPGHEETYDELASHVPTAAALAGFAGHYHSVELATSWVLSIKNGVLVANGPGLHDGVLTPTIQDEFTVDGDQVAVKFTRGPRGITGLHLGAGSLKDVRFERRP